MRRAMFPAVLVLGLAAARVAAAARGDQGSSEALVAVEPSAAEQPAGQGSAGDSTNSPQMGGQAAGPSFARPDLPEFVPTREWQRVLDGQAVPGGLDIRMDLSKGGKWAKLPEGAPEPATEPEPAAEKVEEEHASLDPDQLIAQALPPSALNMTDAQAAQADPETLQRVRRRVWEERQRELREAMAALSKHEVEMGKQLEVLARKDPAPAPTELVRALEVLEDYATKIDFARDLERMGGLAVASSLVEHQSADVARAACWLVGTTVANDPELQTKAVGAGAAGALCRALQRSLREGEPKLAGKAVYALAALARGHALAQKALAEAGAPAILLAAAEHRGGAQWDGAHRKVAAFAGDIVGAAQLGDERFVWAPLREDMASTEWCRAVAGLAHGHGPPSSLEETALSSVQAMAATCADAWHEGDGGLAQALEQRAAELDGAGADDYGAVVAQKARDAAQAAGTGAQTA